MCRFAVLETIQFIFVAYIQAVSESAEFKCDPVNLVVDPDKVCPPKSSCNAQTQTCECNKGFMFKNDVCVVDDTLKFASHTSPNTSSLVDTDGNGHTVAAVLIPIFLVTILVLGVYFGRKYRMFSWVRNKISNRGANYDEFMIGHDVDDDDPPLR